MPVPRLLTAKNGPPSALRAISAPMADRRIARRKTCHVGKFAGAANRWCWERYGRIKEAHIRTAIPLPDLPSGLPGTRVD